MDTYRSLNSVEKLDHPVVPVDETNEDTALDVEDAFGEHDIEYWVTRGNRLVPATCEEVAQIQERERERVAMRRLARLKEAEQHDRSWSARLLRIPSTLHLRWSLNVYHADQGHAGKQDL